MMIKTWAMPILLGIGLVVGAGAFSSSAQDASPKKAAAPAPAASPPLAKKKTDTSRRVPSYFGRIGLTDGQRESIYKVRKTHQEKIDVLKKQIDELEAQELTACESVLNDTQRKLLQNLREGTKKAGGEKNAK